MKKKTIKELITCVQEEKNYVEKRKDQALDRMATLMLPQVIDRSDLIWSASVLVTNTQVRSERIRDLEVQVKNYITWNSMIGAYQLVLEHYNNQ